MSARPAKPAENPEADAHTQRRMESAMSSGEAAEAAAARAEQLRNGSQA